MTIAGKVTSYKKDDFLFCFFSFVERSKGIGDRVYCESYFYDEKITGKRFHNFLQSAGNVKILVVHLTGTVQVKFHHCRSSALVKLFSYMFSR